MFGFVHLIFFKEFFITILKPLYTCGTENKIKVHRFTNNLIGLQKVMVKDFSWNIVPWNVLLFEKTLQQLSILYIENYGFILNTCHDTAKHAETRMGFPVIFSRLRWPIEPKFSQVCYYFYIQIAIHEVWAFGQYCLPKVSNGFKRVCFHYAVVRPRTLLVIAKNNFQNKSWLR